MTLENSLFDALNRAGMQEEKISVCITVDKMNEEQKADFSTFLASPLDDYATLVHDYFGLKRAFIQPNSVHAATFVPRMAGCSTVEH